MHPEMIRTIAEDRRAEMIGRAQGASRGRGRVPHRSRGPTGRRRPVRARVGLLLIGLGHRMARDSVGDPSALIPG
jgi:hypothetical protein